MKRSWLLLLLLLFSASSFAQKTYSEVLAELLDKAKLNILTWSDLGVLAETIEAESKDKAYRAFLCETTLFKLESFLPKSRLVSSLETQTGLPTRDDLKKAILNGDINSVIRSIAGGAHHNHEGVREGPLHAVVNARKIGPDAADRAHLLRLLLTLDLDLESRGDANLTPLFSAVVNSPSLVELLLQAGANASAVDGEGRNPLFYVLRSPYVGSTSVDIFRRLVRFRADINQEMNEGTGLLAYLATYGRADLVREALAAKAYPWAKDRKGRTPLHIATLMGSVDVVRVLLEHFEHDEERSFYVNVRDENGMSPLMLAFAEIPAPFHGRIGHMEDDLRRSRLKIAQMLVAAGALSLHEAISPIKLAILYGSVEPIASISKSQAQALSEEDKIELLSLALDKMPEGLCKKQWEPCGKKHRHKREKIFMLLWRTFEMDLTFDQVEGLERIAEKNGFDIVLEWLLEMKAYPHELNATQKWVLLRQLVRPLPFGVRGAEQENYRNARRRIFDLIVQDSGVILSAEQAEQLERLGRTNRFDEFFDSELWHLFRRQAQEGMQTPRSRRDSVFPHLARRISQLVSPRTSPRASSSDSRESRGRDGAQSSGSAKNSPRSESNSEQSKPRTPRDQEGPGGGSDIRSSLW